MTFFEAFRSVCEDLGFAVIVILIMIHIMWFLSWLWQILKKQKKIKCLCHHMYEKEWETEHVNDSFLYKTEYDLKCRKCGKRKSMTIYHKEGCDLK